VSHRWRYILCGTVRNAVVEAALRRLPQPRPLALPGALPFTLRPEGRRDTACAVSVSGLSSRLNRLREPGQRSSSSPANAIITNMFWEDSLVFQRYELFERAIHHQCIHESQRGMLEGQRQAAYYFEPEVNPQLYSTLVGADHKVELHGTKAAFLGSLQ